MANSLTGAPAAEPADDRRPSVLVIGYGNELRGDDGAGLRVAEALEALRLPGVAVLACHQLTPDLAEPIAAVDHVIFADARPVDDTPGVPPAAEVFDVPANGYLGLNPHHSSPTSLVALTRALYGTCPRATCVAIPTTDFSLGLSLSPVAEQGVRDAVAAIRRLLRHPRKAGDAPEPPATHPR